MEALASKDIQVFPQPLRTLPEKQHLLAPVHNSQTALILATKSYRIDPAGPQSK